MEYRALRKCRRLTQRLFVDIPAGSAFKYMQNILNSHAFKVVRNYLLRPALYTVVLWLVAKMLGYHWGNRLTLEVFLVAALFLNSAFGRNFVEVSTNYLVRIWHELRFASLPHSSNGQWTYSGDY